MEIFVNIVAVALLHINCRESVMKTLGEFIVEKQHEFSHATGELTALLSAIKLGAKIIHRDINKAGLVDILVPAVLRTCRERFSKNSICSRTKN